MMHSNEKTALEVLQEVSRKLGKAPVFSCRQGGNEGRAVYQYRCSILGINMIGRSRKKADALEKSAELMLTHLGKLGYDVPPRFNMCPSVTSTQDEPRTYVARPSTSRRNPQPSSPNVSRHRPYMALPSDRIARSNLEAAMHPDGNEDKIEVLARVADVLGLRITCGELPSGQNPPLALVQLQHATPELAFAGKTVEEAATAALTYVRLAMDDENQSSNITSTSSN